MKLEEKARLFATAAHAAVGQVRKYTFEPYIIHPAAVVAMVKTVDHTPEMLAAAWLHDTVEDTGVTIELIRAEFGSKVSELVGWLTDVSRPEHGNRAHRKSLDRAHIAAAPAEAQTIKLADSICNLVDINSADEAFAAVYADEKRDLLVVLNKGDVRLQQLIRGILER